MVLSHFEPDWVMYPKYFKDTDSAGDVFKSIQKHEKRPFTTNHPLVRHSVRLDRLDSREIRALVELHSRTVLSPNIEDMDSSNNCSIVAKITERIRPDFAIGDGGY